MRTAALLTLAILATLTTGCSRTVDGAAVTRSVDVARDAPVSQRTDCVGAPSTCGFPDATNTGVPHDVRLRVTTGSLEIDEDGAVVENLEVRGSIDISADDVTLRNVKITVADDGWAIGLRTAHGTTIENCEIAPAGPRLVVGIKDVYGDSEGTTIRGCDIARTATGIQLHEGLVEDNYIHAMAEAPGDHVNGFTSNGGVGPLVIHHNTILNERQQTDAIGLFQDFEVQRNRTITDNLLGGGGYTVYGGAGEKGQTSGIVVRDNRFARAYFPAGGQYGPVAYFDAGDPGNIWTGNRWDDSLAEVPAP